MLVFLVTFGRIFHAYTRNLFAHLVDTQQPCTDFNRSRCVTEYITNKYRLNYHSFVIRNESDSETRPKRIQNACYTGIGEIVGISIHIHDVCRYTWVEFTYFKLDVVNFVA